MEKTKVMNIIELENIVYTYSQGTPYAAHALCDVSLKIEKGITTGIIGHTGCGKSTLLQMLNGLIRPMSGRVLFDGEDVWEKPKEISSLRYKVGLVMQYPEYQLFDETVRTDIGYGPRNMGLSKDEIEARVIESADFVNLEHDLLDRSPFELSGGQKRRAAIAGVMAMHPEVLVLDEPAAGLDPRGREEILGGLGRYKEMSGATVVLVSHSMEDMARYCQHIVVMNGGKIFCEGTPAEVFKGQSRLEEIGLSIPEISKIANKLIAAGMPIQSEVYTVEYAARKIAQLLKGGGESV